MVLDHVCREALPFAAALMVRQMELRQPGRRIWLLCDDVRIQDQVHAELAVWHCAALYFPRLHSAATEEALPDPELLAERTSVLSRWRSGGENEVPSAMVLCADSLDEPAPMLSAVEGQRRVLAPGLKFDVDALLVELDAAGYERVPVVTERGQVARRGGIIDFYSWQAEEPLRVELFDDEIESIRAFDIHHQASVRKLDRAEVIFHLSDGDTDTGWVRDYLQKGDVLVSINTEVPEAQVRILCGASPTGGVEDFSCALLENPLGVFDASDFVMHEARRLQFEKQVNEWQATQWRVVIFFHNEAEAERFAEVCDPAVKEAVEPVLGILYRGFTVPTANLAVLTGAEIFGRHQTVRRYRHRRTGYRHLHRR